jgi:hypothetical protein
MQHARRVTVSDYAPSAQEVVQLAVVICHDARPDLYRTEMGNLRKPQWYQRMSRDSLRHVQVFHRKQLPQA